MYLILAKALFLVTMVGVLSTVEGETWWPNFSCHTIKTSKQQRRAVSFNRMGWKNCVEKNKKYKEGNCPKVCKLVDENLVYQEESDGPVIFDTNKFIAHFAEEVGYNLNKPEADEKNLMDKVRLGIDECKQKNPEYEGLKNLQTAICEPWDKFLQCLGKSIGCPPI